jgi:ORF6N domain
MKLALKPENIGQLVFFIRGEKVMLDADLATLYGVSTKALNQALRRNRERFPEDFVFQLTADEFAALRSQSVTLSAKEPHPQAVRSNWSQFVTSSRKHRGARYRPYAFTEQGVAMLSSVLRSKRAVEVNIAIMRTFVQLRRLMDTNRDLARKIEALEKKYDEKFATVFEAIKQLIAAPDPPRKQIGFHP